MINCDYLYNKDFMNSTRPQSHFSNKKLHFRIIENGIILPHKNLPGTCGFGGVVDNTGNYIEESFVHTGIGGAYTPNEEIIESPASVIYLGMFVHIWGHCLTDGIKRTWFLNSDVYNKYFKNYPIVYIPMWGGIIPNFAQILKILEIDVGFLNAIVRPVRFRNIIIPDVAFFSQFTGGGSEEKFFTCEYAEDIGRIKDFARKNFSSLSQKKFYFFHGRNQIGEERIAEYFRSKGYEIICPEKLPLNEQLNILANCENFASSLGSISHNTVFMKDGTEALLIPRVDGGAENIYQLALDDLSGINSSYVDSTLSLYKRDHTGPFCYIISEQLRKFFGDDIEKTYSDEDFLAFLNYVKYAMVNRIPIHKTASSYYAKIISDFMEQLKQRGDLMKQAGVNII